MRFSCIRRCAMAMVKMGMINNLKEKYVRIKSLDIK